MMQNYFARLFISKNTGTSECGPVGARGTSKPFSLRGTFRRAGMQRYDTTSTTCGSFVAVPELLESELEQQQATHTILFTL